MLGRNQAKNLQNVAKPKRLAQAEELKIEKITLKAQAREMHKLLFLKYPVPLRLENEAFSFSMADCARPH